MPSVEDASNPATPGDVSQDDLRIRRRSAIACTNCSKRKVRCNVASSGRPCANCHHDRVQCEVLPRKKQRPRGKRVLPENGNQKEIYSELLQTTVSPSQELRTPEFAGAVLGRLPQSLNGSPGYSQAFSTSNISISRDPIRTRYSLPPDLDEAPNSGNFAVAPDAPTASVPKENPTQIYISDPQGLDNFIHALCNGPAETGTHYLVPRIAGKTHRPEDLAFLRFKGAFSLPPQDVCEDLIQCYFHHVHPFLPIINAGKFLEEFTNRGCQNLSLLRLWSMFFAAANFVENDILRKAGYASRKAMKRVMYQRAKCLYGLDYEEDKISLIQSVILMAFWYSDTEDQFGAWHWLGIAISLCHTVGLHRNPVSSNPNYRLPGAQISVLKRIWWSCVVRDIWFSLSMGRPMRINPRDCTMPMPTAEDVVAEVDNISLPVKTRYIPAHPEWIAGLWVKLLKISELLGIIINIFYKNETMKPDRQDMERFESQLLQCVVHQVEERFSDTISVLHTYQLQLFYEAVVVVLHRPYVLVAASGSILKEEDLWQADSYRKAKAAAANINGVLERLIDANMVKFLKPMTITTLTPAMQMHLLESTSPTPLSRRYGSHKFQLGMMVLSELRSTHWGADAMYRLLEHAQARLQSQQQKNLSSSSLSGDVNLVPLTPDSTIHGQDRPENHPTGLERLLDPEVFMWDLTNPFTIMPEVDLGQNTVSMRGGGGLDWGRDSDSGSVNAGFDINSPMSFEQFSSQCLDMANSTN